MRLKKIARCAANIMLWVAGLMFSAALLHLLVMAELKLFELAKSGNLLSMLPLIFANSIVLVIIATFILGATEDE